MIVLQYILALSILAVVAYFGIINPIIKMVKQSKQRKNQFVYKDLTKDDTVIEDKNKKEIK